MVKSVVQNKVREILETAEVNRSINEYYDLMQFYKMYKANINRVSYIDTAFERFFSSYYGLDASKMTYESKRRYFTCFKALMNGNSKDLETVIREIDKDKVYFSFATKLIATIDTRRPIFDSKVAFALELNQVSGNLYEDRIKNALSIYSNLLEFYKDTTDKAKRFKKNCITEFNNKYSSLKYLISDEKKIDFVLWGAGKINLRIKNINRNI